MKKLRRKYCYPTALLGLLLLPGSAFGQGALSGFEPVGFEIEWNGGIVNGAEVFRSKVSGAFLMIADELPAPILLRLRERRVDTVKFMKIDRKSNGTIDLLPDPVLAPQGDFKLTADRTGVMFSVDGQAATLRERPPLLGDQDIAGLIAHSPQYVPPYEQYQPSDPIVARLRQETRDVRVSIFFGSWCPHCTTILPKVMKVAEQLDGSKVKIHFYGLPPGIVSDPIAEELDLHGVPTGVVYVNGKEVGRISGNSWKVPELAINGILAKS